MFEKMLLPLDRSELPECVFPHAVAMARSFKSRITLLHVLEQVPQPGLAEPVDPVEWSLAKAEAKAYLEKVTSRLRDNDVETDYVLLEGYPAERAVEYARQEGIDLVIACTHGSNSASRRWNMGSVVHKIVERIHTSTMVVRALQRFPEYSPDFHYQHIFVPLDGSQRAELALPVSAMLARSHKARLEIVHVVSPPEMPRRGQPTTEDTQLESRIVERNREEAERYLEQLQRQLNVEAAIRILVDRHVAVRLLDAANESGADLVVMSAHGYSGTTRWRYGGVSSSFLAFGMSPLLLVQDLSPGEIEPTWVEMAAKEHKGH